MTGPFQMQTLQFTEKETRLGDCELTAISVQEPATSSDPSYVSGSRARGVPPHRGSLLITGSLLIAITTGGA